MLESAVGESNPISRARSSVSLNNRGKFVNITFADQNCLLVLGRILGAPRREVATDLSWIFSVKEKEINRSVVWPLLLEAKLEGTSFQIEEEKGAVVGRLWRRSKEKRKVWRGRV